jgi:Ca-activated chloride channel family protein
VSHVHFAQPLALLLLALVPPLVAWWVWQRRAAFRFPDSGLARALPAGRSRLAQWAAVFCRAAGLVLLIVALAGPRWPDEGSRIPTHGIAIAIALDVSGSMADKDFAWAGKDVSRLEAAKKVFALLIEGGEGPQGRTFPGRRTDQVALVTFATRPETVCPLTLDHQVLMRLLAEQKPRSVPTEARTNIGDALAWALSGLADARGERVIILLSDGEHNVPPPALMPRQAAQLAGNLGVKVFVVDAGRESPAGQNLEEDKVNRQRAEKILKEVAEITKGRYFQAHDTQALLEVSREIDRILTNPIPSFQYRRYHEGFVWFAAAAFVFFFGIQFLEVTLWRRVP